MRYCPRCGTTTEALHCVLDGTPTVRQVEANRRGVGPGDVVGGRYRVLGELGRGGFGQVFDTVHVTTGHPVAVKVLQPVSGNEGQELARRFFQEAATTSRLTHPNTVRVFDFGQTDGGELFIAMERLSGETLQALLARTAAAGGALDVRQVVETGAAVLRSLGEAHALGLVHRDMKPANIFLHQMAGGEAIVKVLDFGIVKTHDTSMTQAGKALGTPTHMSPEQAMGQDVGPQSDLYSLAVVLYECLTGSLPFQADNPLTLVMKHVTEAPEPVVQRSGGRVSAAVAAVVERALLKDPAARWPSAADMRQALEAAVSQTVTSGAVPTPPPMVAVAMESAASPPPVQIASARPVDLHALHGDTAPVPVWPGVVERPLFELASDDGEHGDDGMGAKMPEAPRFDRLPTRAAHLSTSDAFAPLQLAPRGGFLPEQPMPSMSLGVGDLLSGMQQATRAMPLAQPAQPSLRQVEAMCLSDGLRHAVYADPRHQIHVAELGELGHHPLSVLDLVDTLVVGGHDAVVEAVAGTPDGRLVASASIDGWVCLWDVASGRRVAAELLESTPTALGMASDGKLLVVGGADGSAALFELPGLTLRRTLRGHREAVTAVACAGSKRLVVTASEDGMVRTWDPVGGGARLTARAHDGAVAAVAVNAAGQMVASGGWDGKLHVWYGRTGDSALELPLHDDIIAGVAVDRSGTLVATAGDDKVVRVVHILSGEVRAERRDFRTGVKHVRFADEGNLLVAGAWDGTFRRLTW